MRIVSGIMRQGYRQALIIIGGAILCPPVVAAASDVDPALLAPRDPPVWIRIAQATIPRVIVEAEGEYRFSMPADGDGVRRLTIGTDHLTALRRFWRDDSTRSARSSWPVLQTTVEWDLASNIYALQRVEIGFFNRWIWLVHELPDTEEGYGSIGVQIKLEW